MRRAVFLDRDGVINANIERDGRPVAPTTLAEFRFLPGVADAIARLKAMGFLTIVVTNQPDVATGRTPKAVVEAMHAEVLRNLVVDAVKACWHVDADRCACRKPKPGLLLEAAAEWSIELPASWMIGDRWRDVVAGQTAGCLTILVDCGYHQEVETTPDLVVRSLPEAVAAIERRELMGKR